MAMRSPPPAGHAKTGLVWDDIVNTYGSKSREDLTGGYMTDLEVAVNTAMLMRDDFDHEAVLQTARDRIRWLSVQLAAARAELEYVRGMMEEGLLFGLVKEDIRKVRDHVTVALEKAEKPPAKEQA